MTSEEGVNKEAALQGVADAIFGATTYLNLSDPRQAKVYALLTAAYNKILEVFGNKGHEETRLSIERAIRAEANLKEQLARFAEHIQRLEKRDAHD